MGLKVIDGSPTAIAEYLREREETEKTLNFLKKCFDEEKDGDVRIAILNLINMYKDKLKEKKE